MSAPAVSVYFVQAEDGGSIKIGRSSNPVLRLASLQTSHPKKLQILATCPGDFGLEGRIHDRLSRFREHGEWFRENDALATIIAMIRENAELVDPYLSAYKKSESAAGRIVAEHCVDLVYEILQRTLAVYGGEEKLARAMGTTAIDIHERVNRMPRNKQPPWKAPIDYFGAFMCDPASSEFLLTSLCLMSLSADAVRTVAWNATGAYRRQLERENNLPAGSLDR
jgi:hypothetical protein